MKQLNYILLTILFVIGFMHSVSAQNGVIPARISGTVLESATGKPLAGAKVSITGVTSSITDEKGKFNLAKKTKGAYLQIDAPGFASKRIALLNDSNIVIRLMDETFKGKYEDIATPFEMTNMSVITNAVSSHENREDYKLGATSIETVLQGSVNGLNTVSRTGAPGAGANMYLNGFNSLNATNQPLIIVNGIPYENQTIYSLITGNNVTPLSDIDVKDIENVTVLKSGASIYGSKGANGAIVINTLTAKDASTRINFHAYTGVNMETNSDYKMLDAGGYKNYLVDMLSNKGMSINDIQALPYINSEKPVVEKWGVSGNADYYRYNQSTNWQNQVLKSSLTQNYHLSVTGGNDVALYAISFGYLNQGGAVDQTSFNRYSTRVNAKIKMTDWFKLIANMSLVYSERNLSFEGLNRNFNPVFSGLIKAPFTSPYVYNVLNEVTPNLEGADIFNISNPRAIIDNSNTSSNRFRFLGNMNGILTFSKHLSASVLVGITTDKSAERVFLPQAGLYHTPLPSAIVTNEAQQLRDHFLQINSDIKLTYKQTFNYIHDLSIHVGSRYQNSSSELDWGKSYNSSSDEMKTLGDGINALAQIGGSLGNWNTVSNYLNVDYALLNRYFVSFNGALDGSSRFGKQADGLHMFKNTFGLFPSVSAAWLVTSENFMKHQKVFDVLKIRTGYSISGNDDMGNYSARGYYVSQGLLGAYGLVRGNIPNEKLSWETNYKEFLGIDASFFKERLNLGVDLFTSQTKNLLGTKNITSNSGLGLAVYNDGELQNSGIDLNITGRIVDKSNFKWDLGLNVSTYKNLLQSKSVDETITTIAGGNIRTKVGSSIAEFYGYQTAGVFSTKAEATAANLKIKNTDGTEVAFQAGDMIFVDRNKDHYIDEKDMTVIGNPNPTFFGAITNRFQYKRFTLSTLFNFSYGNSVYNALRSNLESMSNTDNQTIAASSRWKTDGQITTIPKAAWGDPMMNSRFSDRWIEDGSFIRLKSLTLSYDIPFKSGFLNSAQIYLTGNNLLTLTKYLGYDPEFNTSSNPLYYGIDTGVSAQPRTVLIGVKIGL
ncbi:MAG: SusC/RagA family TonB-linked outer membrane protein [Paludibacter sp.]|nr:SusC/RagA family TonB-linked outer membrane protein [Paludibacter sp.]